MIQNKVMIYIIVLAFIAGFFFDYNNLKEEKDKKFFCSIFMEKERNAILEKGDTSAYKLYMDSIAKSNQIPLSNSFCYSCFMALYCNYIPANYDAYQTIMQVYPDSDSMDVDTKKLCVYFLKRGADRDDKRCLNILNKMYIKYQKVSCDTVYNAFENIDNYDGIRFQYCRVSTLDDKNSLSENK